MASLALSTVFDITPSVLYLPEEQCVCSLAASKQHLYLAVCQYSAERADIVGSIYRYDSPLDQWQLLDRRLFSDAVKDPEEGIKQLQGLQCELAVLNVGDSDWLFVYFASSTSRQLICAKEGEKFTDCNAPELGQEWTIRQFLYAESQLYTLWAQVGQLESGPVTLAQASLIDPQSLGEWRILNLTQTDEVSHSITALDFWNNRLYAATSNKVTGFELWCKGEEEPWQQIHRQGLYRYSLNARIRFIVPFKEALYLATDPVLNSVYSDGFELIRLYSDNDWDLIVGMPRFTPVGLRVPLLCQGPGFGRAIGAPLCLTVHDGALYLGFQTLEGFQLWRSTEGNVWSQVAVPSLSQYYQVSQLVAASTTNALALMCIGQESPGTSNRRLFAYE